MKGKMGTGICPFFELGKWDLLHWDWDSITGNGMNNFENGKEILIFSAL